MIDTLESEGIYITTKISNEESGKPKPLVLRRDFPADTVLLDGTFNGTMINSTTWVQERRKKPHSTSQSLQM